MAIAYWKTKSKNVAIPENEPLPMREVLVRDPCWMFLHEDIVALRRNGQNGSLWLDNSTFRTPRNSENPSAKFNFA